MHYLVIRFKAYYEVTIVKKNNETHHMTKSLWTKVLFFQHDSATVHKASSMNRWFVKVGVKELEKPHPTEYL